jgi:nucleoside-diphosphate-sugar epimerase
MKALVLGASGATGKLVVNQFIERKITTRILIRESAVIPEEFLDNPLVEIIKGSITELDQSDLAQLVSDCEVVVSCLGHNLSLQGMYGQPRYLVLDTIRSLSQTVQKTTKKKIKIILMSTTAYTNTFVGEKNSLAERIIFGLLMNLLPPHRDNVMAAEFLIKKIGNQDEMIEWVAVRPDTLIDSDEVSAYEVCESPVRSPMFDAGETSRINVGHFMAELASDESLWNQWVFKTPVLYNQ